MSIVVINQGSKEVKSVVGQLDVNERSNPVGNGRDGTHFI